MTCLCNVPSDLASDGIAEPKTTEKGKKKKGGVKQNTKKKSTGDISDKRKQMLRKRGLQSGGHWIKM